MGNHVLLSHWPVETAELLNHTLMLQVRWHSYSSSLVEETQPVQRQAGSTASCGCNRPCKVSSSCAPGLNGPPSTGAQHCDHVERYLGVVQLHSLYTQVASDSSDCQLQP